MRRLLFAVLPVMCLISCLRPVLALDGTAPAGQSKAAKVGSIPCPRCKHENRADAKFCVECGAVMQVGGCPRCGAAVSPGDRFCSQCGLQLNLKTGPGEPAGKAGNGDKPGKDKAGAAPGDAGGAKDNGGAGQNDPAAGKNNDTNQNPPEQGEAPRYPLLTIGGFHDIVYSGTGRGAQRYFSLGQFILHLTSDVGPGWHAFSEISLTPRTDAGTGSPSVTPYNADVERAIIRYVASDQLKASLGRYHTPVNYWNTAFHHGLWLQTTIARPEMVKFGSTFIPVHFVGALIEGMTPAHGLNLNYNLGIGNGRGPTLARAGDAGDVNSELAYLVTIFVRPDALPDVQLGGSVYRDKVTVAPATHQYNEWLWSAHAVLLRESPEVITEYTRIQHSSRGVATTNSEGFYAQIAYRLMGHLHKLKPYYRFERMVIPGGEPVFSTTPAVSGSIYGFRYDLADFVALKFEYRDLGRSPGPSTRGLFGQVSYTF